MRERVAIVAVVKRMCVIVDEGHVGEGRGVDKDSRFEGGHGVGERARQGGSLARAACDHDDEGAMDRGDMSLGESERFSSPFRVTLHGAAMLVECCAKQFKGDAIKEFFLIIADDSEDAVCGLVDVFESEDVG